MATPYADRPGCIMLRNISVRAPLVTILMILLLITLFQHTALGLQVVVEDYVHSGAKFAAVIAVRLGCFVLAAAGIVATLGIAFSG
jgi:succinate dehydrogenase / fumarate reductase membrane anchor subunit